MLLFRVRGPLDLSGTSSVKQFLDTPNPAVARRRRRIMQIREEFAYDDSGGGSNGQNGRNADDDCR